MDKENNGMHMNPITNYAKKKKKNRSVKKLKTENFLVSIV